LGIGIAGTVGDRLGSLAVPSLPSYKTTGQQTLFRYRSDGTAAGTVEASGDLHRLSPQAFYYWKSFGFLGEYVLSSQDVRRGSNSAQLQNSSWQLAASFVLTGENASYRGVTPKRPLEKGFGSWGALEIAGRYSQLLADGAAFPVYANPQSSARKADAWAIGLNWYLNRIFKAVLNYERTDFQGGAAAGNREPENAIVSRLQIAY
jgi:phosphate-selective porin OprO/OprP